MNLLKAQNPSLKIWRIWLAALIATALWDWSGLDQEVMTLIGTAQGFELKHNRLLEVWLHDHVRNLGWLLYFSLWLWIALKFSQHTAAGKEKTFLMLLVTANLLTISYLKNMSQTSCPWSVSQWGGVATYVSHWQWGVSDGGPGRCFPGGHASVAWAFSPWLIAAWWPSTHLKRLHRHRWAFLIALITAALVTGVTQTLRGAHYPSHTAWTALICCTLSLTAWAIWQKKHHDNS